MSRCPQCHDELPAKANFCGKCGLSLLDNVEENKSSMVVEVDVPKTYRWHKVNSFWIIVSLMLCLIVVLGAFITSTYVAKSSSGTTRVVGSIQPTLSLRGPLSATVQQGQTLTLHGEQFGANNPIAFLLDFALPIKDKYNRKLTIRSSREGSLDVSIPVQGSEWSVNTHTIEGIDTLSRQRAYFTVVVSPAVSPVSTSQNLALSMQGQPVTALTFQTVAGQGDPDQQRVTLTNTSGASLSWTVTANADHDLSWLVIDDNHLAGNLDIAGTDSIGISVLTTALKSNPHPYTGQIVFTINGQEQLTLPVALQVVDAPSEIVFTPNPAVATLGPGNTCQAPPFTMINVGRTFVSWTLVPFDDTKDHVQFMANGQPITQGVLASSGTPGDTQILTLQCSGVVAGNSYQFTMYTGNTSWPVTITIPA